MELPSDNVWCAQAGEQLQTAAACVIAPQRVSWCEGVLCTPETLLAPPAKSRHRSLRGSGILFRIGVCEVCFSAVSWTGSLCSLCNICDALCKCHHRLTARVTSDDRPRALLLAGGYTDRDRTAPRIPLRTVPQAGVKVQPGLALAPPTTHATRWILSTKHPRRELQACRT